MRSGFLPPGAIGPVAFGGSGELADPVPVAGGDVVLSGGFDSETGWTVGASWTIGAGVATGTGSSSALYRSVLTSQLWYMAQIDVVSGTCNVRFNGAFITALTAGAGRFATGRADGTLAMIRDPSATVVDNCTYKPLTLATLLSTRAYASADCDLSAAITRTAGTQAGLCARLDSASTPANFLIAYLDGAGNVKVDKCVAGVYTNVISGAVTYGSTKRLRLVCSGTSVSAYYDGTQVGSTVTVSDAGIVSNTRHGKFSTYAANTFSGYVAA